MSRLRAYAVGLIVGFIVVSEAWAQEPAAKPQSSSQEPTQATQPVKPVKARGEIKKPDDRPLSPILTGTAVNAPFTGATEQRWGPVSSRSYFVPAVEFYGQLDSNGNNTSSGRFVSINSVLGSLAVQKMGRASQINMDYLGGRSFSTQNSVFNSTTHELGVSGLLSRGRWDGFVADRFLYSSQSSFFGGVLPFNVTEFADVSGLRPSGPMVLRDAFVPGQGIFTNFGPRLSNSVVAQVTNHLNRRAFVTIVGNYNTLHFFNSGLIDTSAAGFQVGAGYQRTRQEAIALVYRFDDLWFTGSSEKIRDHVIELAYEHRLGERLLFQIGAGPEIDFIREPGQSAEFTSDTRVSWTADTSLRYQFTRATKLDVGYNHYVTGGSGVFRGAVTDRGYFTASHDWSRIWKLSLTASYMRNANLMPLVVGTTNVPEGTAYNSVFGGFEAERRVGRDSNIFVGYLARYQTAKFNLCPAGICIASDFVGHQINFGFVWRLRPIPID